MGSGRRAYSRVKRARPWGGGWRPEVEVDVRDPWRTQICLRELCADLIRCLKTRVTLSARGVIPGTVRAGGWGTKALIIFFARLFFTVKNNISASALKLKGRHGDGKARLNLWGGWLERVLKNIMSGRSERINSREMAPPFVWWFFWGGVYTFFYTEILIVSSSICVSYEKRISIIYNINF